MQNQFSSIFSHFPCYYLRKLFFLTLFQDFRQKYNSTIKSRAIFPLLKVSKRRKRVFLETSKAKSYRHTWFTRLKSIPAVVSMFSQRNGTVSFIDHSWKLLQNCITSTAVFLLVRTFHKKSFRKQNVVAPWWLPQFLCPYWIVWLASKMEKNALSHKSAFW